jgi:hypothetical protein
MATAGRTPVAELGERLGPSRSLAKFLPDGNPLRTGDL